MAASLIRYISAIVSAKLNKKGQYGKRITGKD
jgi:hypothetical protein